MRDIMVLGITDISSALNSGKTITSYRGTDYTYYIHNSFSYVRVEDYRYFTSEHWGDEVSYIEDIFNELDIAVEPDFRRVYNKNEALLKIYRTTDLIMNDNRTLGVTYSTFLDTQAQLNVQSIDIVWKPIYESSGAKFIDEYGILKDNNAYTLLHEIAHAVGLSHSSWDPDDNRYNSSNTVMSYNYVSQPSKKTYQSKAPIFTELDLHAIRATIGIESSAIRYQGEDYEDLLFGGSKSDTISGGGGNDLLNGGPEPVADYLYGEAGDDYLAGGGGPDQLYGGTGNDEIRAGHGKDTISGGNGADILYGGGGTNSFLSEADGSIDQLYVMSDFRGHAFDWGRNHGGINADIITEIDANDRITILGTSDSALTFRAVAAGTYNQTRSGIGIFDGDSLEALYIGSNLNASQLDSMTTGDPTRFS